MKRSPIKLKAKKCKGTGKAAGFDACGQPFLDRRYGLCRSCFNKWLLTTEEGKETINRISLKAQKQVKEKKKKEHKEAKRRITNWKNKLQTKVQEISRLIDFGQPCLARQTIVANWNGGHVWAKGPHPECRFNLHNIHKQSAQSNMHFNDEHLMWEGLKRVYGTEYHDFVKQLANKNIPKLSNEEYEQAYRRACQFANELKKDLRKRSTTERISLRNKANKKIGIYL